MTVLPLDQKCTPNKEKKVRESGESDRMNGGNIFMLTCTPKEARISPLGMS